MADETEDVPKKRTTQKKTAAPRKRAASSAGRQSSSSATRTRKTSERQRPTAVKIARSAREQLSELLGKDSETVIGIHRTDDGWEVDLEVVETHRIPDTTDVLAIYRVQVDGGGDVEGYQRLERYIRGKAEGGVTGG